MQFKPMLFNSQLYILNSQLLMQREMCTFFQIMFRFCLDYVIFQNLYWERPAPGPRVLESPQF